MQAKAQQALGESSVYALRELTVDCDDDTLTIVGQVTSFYHKQLAQEIVRQAISGVEVVNAIRVL
jgi:hypothetical protein